MPESRNNIPDLWVARISCPICGAQKLDIKKSENLPDQIACSSCGIHLEVEDGGDNLMIAIVPRGISTRMTGRWVSFSDLIDIGHRLAERQNGHTEDQPSGNPEPEPIQVIQQDGQVPITSIEEPPIPEALAKEKIRVKELYSLGNSPQQIRTKFNDSTEFLPDEIESIMEEVETLEKNKVARQKKRMVYLLIFIVVTILCIGACAVVSSFVRNNLMSVMDVNPSPEVEPEKDTILEGIFNVIPTPGPDEGGSLQSPLSIDSIHAGSSYRLNIYPRFEMDPAAVFQGLS